MFLSLEKNLYKLYVLLEYEHLILYLYIIPQIQL